MKEKEKSAKDLMKVKAIFVEGKEWYDRAGRNHYCSVNVLIVYNSNSKGVTPDPELLYLPMEMGCNDYYRQMAAKAINKHFNLQQPPVMLFRLRMDGYKFMLIQSLQEGCKKKEVVQFGQNK